MHCIPVLLKIFKLQNIWLQNNQNIFILKSPLSYTYLFSEEYWDAVSHKSDFSYENNNHQTLCIIFHDSTCT